MPPVSKQPRTCPCKLLPQSLSSFTAAEYGDIHYLSKVKDIATRKDDAGYSPLHLSAQFNHVAATVFLLQIGCPVDGVGEFTPLHRAAFSGAVAAMKVLLEWNAPGNDASTFSDKETPSRISASTRGNFCDLLARDTSFGDESTPLHKAAAGGRYLAVHMILEALKERDSSSLPKSKPSWLQRGLEAKDKYGRTPLDVARHFFKIQSTEREAVARWDAVAGGVADWEKCIRLLENECTEICGANETGSTRVNKNVAGCSSTSHQSKNILLRQKLPSLPLHFTKGVMACLDCQPIPGDNNANTCLTSSWQADFQKALGASANMCIVAPKIRVNTCITASKAGSTTLRLDTTKGSVAMEEDKPKENISTIQSLCTRCKKPTIAFYQLPGTGIMVCKRCRRLAK